MTRTTNSGISTVRYNDRPVGEYERGIVIATSEARVAEWLCELVQPCMGRRYVLRHAATQGAFASMAQMPGMAMAFIEIGFFGEAMLGNLGRLHKLYPRLRVILFAVSETAAEETARYLCWGGGGFISLRDRPEEIEEQLNAVFEGKNRTPGDVLRCMRDYERLNRIESHLTRQEIEVVRCVAREKTRKETAYCLKVSEKTVSNHLENIRMKFGVHNLVGILKLAVTKGVLPEKELWSCRFRCGGRGC